MIAYPAGLTFEEWSSLIVEEFAQDGIEQWRPEEEEWKRWGEFLANADEIDVPDTFGFKDWRAWGERVVELNY
jgi:hypothetical protein